MIQLSAALAAYFLFHAAFFGFASHVFGTHPARWKTLGVTFAVNFILFYAASMMMLPLPVNWTLVALLFSVEAKVLYRVPWTDCIGIALIGATVGLSGTIFMRSLCSLALGTPLTAFSNGADNEKALPVVLGFLLSAAAMRAIDIPNNRSVLITVMSERRTLAFLIVELVLCYLYLSLNLLLYESSLNSVIIKLWSIKTAVFVSLGAVMAVWFAYRMASVLSFARRRETLAREIAQNERASAEIEDIADHDELTGCFTRDFATRETARLLAEPRQPVTLVFADLDGLKTVNDLHGHEAGDSYIAAAAMALQSARGSVRDFVARYGGDEFLVVLTGAIAPATLAERMTMAQRTLDETARSERFPFEPTLSWGSASAGEGEGFEDLVARADAAMYRRKRSAKKPPPRA